MIPITQKTPTNLPPAAIPATIDQTAKDKEIAANTIQTSTKEELAQYYHQCLLSPPKPTLLQAIDNQPFKTFPGLTYELISKHLPPSTATDKGHMKRRKQNIRSTRSSQQAIKNAKFEVSDMNPPNKCVQHWICFVLPHWQTRLKAPCTQTSLENSQYDPTKIINMFLWRISTASMPSL